MDIRDQLLLEHSKENSNRIKEYIGEDHDRFRILLDLFLGEEYRVSQRAAMVLSACYDEHPDLVKPYRKELIKNLLENDPDVAIRRNTVRILQFMEVPSKYKAKVFDYCLERLYEEDETVAVKAFCMLVAYNICVDFPELGPELQAAIYLNMENSEKPGIHSRGKGISKKLAKL